jgi:pentapeptide MXKDX repeat protein
MKKVLAALLFTLAFGAALAFASGSKDTKKVSKDDAMVSSGDTMAPKDAMKADTMAPKDTMKADTMAPKDTMKADTMAPKDAMKADTMAPKDAMKADTMAPKDAMKADTMAPKDTMKGDAMMADPAKAVFDLTGLGPAVTPYSGEAAAQRLAASKRVVYFFAASWCPTCKATYEELKTSAMKAPKDLALVVVDYDKEADLKAKYGITYQHTFVAIGAMGEKRKVWSGTTTLADIIAQTPKM